MLIDANIFLEVLLKQEKSNQCKELLNKLISGEVSAVVSTFTIDSILLSMHRNGCSLEEMRQFMRKILRSRGIRFYVLSMKDRMGAFKYIKEYGLDYEDALVLQSAIITKCTRIVSFDSHFDRVKEITRVENFNKN